MSMLMSGDKSTPMDAAVGSSAALTLCKTIQFEGLQVELFQDIDDPVAAAEGEIMMSQMQSAEMQLAAGLGRDDALEQGPFEREAVSVEVQDKFESSSVGADSNR